MQEPGNGILQGNANRESRVCLALISRNSPPSRTSSGRSRAGEPPLVGDLSLRRKPGKFSLDASVCTGPSKTQNPIAEVPTQGGVGSLESPTGWRRVGSGRVVSRPTQR